MEKINSRSFRVFGLRRSGNHAIINWIQNQIDAPVLFLNDRELLNPFEELNDKSSADIKILIHSYEEQWFDREILKRNDELLRKSGFEPDQSYDILILRDPLNLFASRIKSGYTSTWRTPRLDQLDLFLLYAKEFLGKSKELTNKISINYNEWVTSELYQKQIAEKLGLSLVIPNEGTIPQYGGGSSFNKGVTENPNIAKETQQRWLEFTLNKEFLDIISSRSLRKNHKRIFHIDEKAQNFYRDNKIGLFSTIGDWIRGLRLILLPHLLRIAFIRRMNQQK